MKIHKITWLDIVGGKEWMSYKEAINFGEIKYKTEYYSIGHIIFKDKRFVVLAATYTVEEDGELSFNDVSMIPRSVISKIELL